MLTLEDGGEVFGRWESLAGFGFAVGDGAADLAGDLLVEVGGVLAVDLDNSHETIDSSIIYLKSNIL